MYGLLVALVMIVSLGRASLFFAASIRASTVMHDGMVRRVLRAPLSFFHTTPVGRILNRFSNDLGRVDDQVRLRGCCVHLCSAPLVQFCPRLSVRVEQSCKHALNHASTHLLQLRPPAAAAGAV